MFVWPVEILVGAFFLKLKSHEIAPPLLQKKAAHLFKFTEARLAMQNHELEKSAFYRECAAVVIDNVTYLDDY